MPPLLSIQNLRVTLEGRTILRDVSVDLFPSEVFLLLGRSGTGKSVLIKSALGFLPRESGAVLLQGNAVSTSALLQSVTLVHQAPALLEDETALDNVSLPLQWRHRLRRKNAIPRAHEALAAVGATRLADTVAAQLSAGERKLVALARALAMKPLALLLDEPTTGLDAASAARVGHTVGHIAHSGTAVLVVTHDVEPFRACASRVALLHDGALLLNEQAPQVFDTPSPAMRQFLTAASEGPLEMGGNA